MIKKKIQSWYNLLKKPSQKSHFMTPQVSLKETQHLEVAKFNSKLSESATGK